MNTLLGFPATHGFGRLLRQWRTTRHMSQLALATDAGISARHLSFLETGRAQPSREMVQLLAGMLDVPLGERNALLMSAGYAPIYGERPLGAPELKPVRRALEFILRQQEPYPALVLDGQWNMVMRNSASKRIFDLSRGPSRRRADQRHAYGLSSERVAALCGQLGAGCRVPHALGAPGSGHRRRRRGSSSG
jgi:transcriptional regulator with XRE-family HTH domain